MLRDKGFAEIGEFLIFCQMFGNGAIPKCVQTFKLM